MDRGYGRSKKEHPKDGASLVSLISFWYIFKFIKRGRKKGVSENDLTNAMKSLKSKTLGDQLENCWNSSKKAGVKPSIIKTILSCYGVSICVLWTSNFAESLLQTYSIAWATGNFVSYFENGQTNVTRLQAFIYAMVLVLIRLFNGIWKEHYYLLLSELGLRVQTSLSSLIYRKVLTLKQTKMAGINTGRIVTGITKDVQKINEAVLIAMDDIGEIFQVIFVTYLLYQKIGITSTAGIGIILASAILQFALARVTYKCRVACNEKSDQRLEQIQEILSSIRLIKMYRWELFFERKLLSLRKKELKNLSILFILKSVSHISGRVTGKIAHIVTLLICLWFGKTLNADIVYYTTTLFKRVSSALGSIPVGIQIMSECMVAVKRVNLILHAEENQICKHIPNSISEPEVFFSNADVDIDGKKILKDISIKMKAGLNILIGPTGSGKSSVLKTILKEYTITKGDLSVQGTVSYACQNPWLFPSSLKQNILFGEPLDENKYNTILELCGLKYDINNFSNGDEMILKDCGANLSGGQKARLNLARALYMDADIYLIDDCLASLDINIKKHVFNNAIRGYLNRKLCLLVTHSTQFVHQADNVLIMENGTIVYSGKPENIRSGILQHKRRLKNNDIYVDSKTNKNVEGEIEEDFTEEMEMLLPKINDKQKGNIYEEKKKSGSVGFQAYKNYLEYGNIPVMLGSICSVFIIAEILDGLGEKFLSKWLNSLKTVPERYNNFDPVEEVYGNITLISSSTESYLSVSSIPPEYESIVTAMGNYTMNLTAQTQFELSQFYYFEYFVSTALLGIFFSFAGMFVSLYFSMKISKNIHKDMVHNLLQGYMHFFDTHLIGNIMVRFSKDLFLIDDRAPYFWNGVRIVFVLGISLTLIASVNLVFASMSLFLLVIFYFITEYVLSTTRDLQRLCNSTLSPMIGHLNATLEGLPTIRVHGTQKLLAEEFDKQQDTFITAEHLKHISCRFMDIYCRLVGCCFHSFVTIQLLFLAGIQAGDAGLVLSQSYQLSFQMEIVLIMWMFIENSMTCVERILEYVDQPQENQTGTDLIGWPSQGEIKFNDVSLKYHANSEIVLKNLNFIISPQQKIGVVGRTGAGKSSIILTLFRMYDFSGHILIDDVNIKSLSLECLRNHLAVIPQDPVIFTGTVRTNIDPFGTISDDEIWKILDIVNLKSYFQSLEEDIGQRNLSIGEKQLIAMARALTKKTKVVILDEATANMDEAMDLTVHTKIQELFKSCTVITIAHRLTSVMDNDKILVMDNGLMVEFDTPQNLLSNTKGYFYKLVYESENIESIPYSEKKIL